MDEILTCELDEFSDAMGGTMLSDWRRLGGDGIEVSTTEDGVDVRYSFTLESSSTDCLDRLKFSKTITVDQIPGKILSVRISEGYSASTKTITSRTTSYSAVESPADDGDDNSHSETFANIGEEEAVELMDEGGCLQLVEQLSTSPMEFFVNAYLEYDESTPYSHDDWGYYEDSTADELGSGD